MRIQSFQEFWPFYLSQHSNLYCRILHFFGTTAFFLILLLCFLLNGWQIVAGIGITSVLSSLCFRMESKRNSFPILIVMITILAIADWWIYIGIFIAYLCAWIGHFIIEKNRPATFTYPLWSLAGDFRMWGGMCIGHYWNPDISKHWNDVPPNPE